MKKKTYIFMLSDKDRKRHEHLKDKGKVLEFVVQYEILLGKKWLKTINLSP